MQFVAYDWPAVTVFEQTAGGWRSKWSLGEDRWTHLTDEDARRKVAAMAAVGWSFADARRDGFPF